MVSITFDDDGQDGSSHVVTAIFDYDGQEGDLSFKVLYCLYTCDIQWLYVCSVQVHA